MIILLHNLLEDSDSDIFIWFTHYLGKLHLEIYDRYVINVRRVSCSNIYRRSYSVCNNSKLGFVIKTGLLMACLKGFKILQDNYTRWINC